RGNGARQPRRAADDVGRIQPLLAADHDVAGFHAEDRDVLGADVVADFDIGAVERADGHRAVQRELHVAGAGGLHAGGGDLLGEIGGGDDHLRQAYIVVRQEGDLQPSPQVGIVIHGVGDVVDQLDDQLCVVIARRRLAGEDLYSWHPVPVGLVLHRLVQ